MHKPIQNIVPATLMTLTLCGPAVTQIVDTAVKEVDTAIIAGLRLTIDF